MSQKLPMILLKLPKQDIDAAFLKHVAGQCNCYGAAFVENGTVTNVTFDKPPDVDDCVKQLADFNDLSLLLWFNNIENGMSPEHLQPIPLLKDKSGNIVIAAACCGTFDKYIREGTSAPSSFYLAAEYLIPKLQDMYESTGNVDKLWTKLKQPMIEKDFVGQIGNEDFISLISCSGAIQTFRNVDTIPIIQPWGWTTGLLGFGEQQQTTGLVRSSKVKTDSPQVTPVKPEPEQPAVEVPVEGDKFDFTSDEPPMIDGPPIGWTRKQKEKFYQQNGGWVPKNCIACPKVKIHPDKWKKMRAEHAGVTTVNTLADIGNVTHVGATTVIHATPTPIAPDTAVPLPQEMRPVPPIINPEDRERILKLLTEVTVSGSEKFPDGSDEKHSTGFQQLGLGPEAAFSWSRKGILRPLVVGYPQAASILWKDCINVMRVLAIKNEALNKLLDEVTDPKEPSVPLPEIPLPAPATPPVQKQPAGTVVRQGMRRLG